MLGKRLQEILNESPIKQYPLQAAFTWLLKMMGLIFHSHSFPMDGMIQNLGKHS